MNVDMATYKAEFLSHYYEGRLRPRHAYAMGWIYWWARLASLAPGVVNFVTHAPVVGKLFQVAGRHRDPARRCPSFAPETFKAWWSPPGAAERRHGRAVILWPDTFNNHFHPADGQGGRRGAGGRRASRSSCPRQSLCCGRPLYDFGMLDTAKGLLRADPRHAAAGDRGGHAGRRPGAELRGRLPRRADEPLPDGRGRQAAQRPTPSS